MENQQKTKTRFRMKEGRWTRAEQNNFLQALQKYGRNWGKIQKKVKTRSVIQVRSHAQKFFLEMSETDIKAFIGSDAQSQGQLSSYQNETQVVKEKQSQKVQDKSQEQIKKNKSKKKKRKEKRQDHIDQQDQYQQKEEQSTLKEDKQISPLLIPIPINCQRRKDDGPSYFSQIFNIYKKKMNQGISFLQF